MKLLPAHWLLILVVLVVGFWLGKKYPSALSNVPLVNKVLG